MLLLLAMVMPPIAGAVLPPDLDAKETVFKLPAPSKHWVWVNDFVFPHMADGMAYLVDGDVIVVVYVVKRQVIDRITIGRPVSCIAVSRDDSCLYVGDYDGAVTALPVRAALRTAS